VFLSPFWVGFGSVLGPRLRFGPKGPISGSTLEGVQRVRVRGSPKRGPKMDQKWSQKTIWGVQKRDLGSFSRKWRLFDLNRAKSPKNQGYTLQSGQKWGPGGPKTRFGVTGGARDDLLPSLEAKPLSRTLRRGPRVAGECLIRGDPLGEKSNGIGRGPV